MFLNDLSIGYPIEIHGLDLDCLSRRWDTEESPPVRASHGETRGHLVAFCYQLLQRPLDVREARAHHRDDRQIAVRSL